MGTIDPNGHLHDDLGRYASQHRPAANFDLAALGGDLNPPTTEGDSDLKKEDLYRIGAAVGIGAVAITGITACSNNNNTPPEPGPSVTAPAETPAPEAPTPTPEPEPEVDEPVEAPEAPVPTEIGALVPADQIDAARDAGASVYVSPRGDGAGLVVDPNGPLPEQVRADIEAMPISEPTTRELLGDNLAALHEQHFAMSDSGMTAFRVLRAPTFEQDMTVSDMNWVVFSLGLPLEATRGTETLAPTREGAIARAAEQFGEWWNPDNLFG